MVASVPVTTKRISSMLGTSRADRLRELDLERRRDRKARPVAERRADRRGNGIRRVAERVGAETHDQVDVVVAVHVGQMRTPGLADVERLPGLEVRAHSACENTLGFLAERMRRRRSLRELLEVGGGERLDARSHARCRAGPRHPRSRRNGPSALRPSAAVDREPRDESRRQSAMPPWAADAGKGRTGSRAPRRWSRLIVRAS